MNQTGARKGDGKHGGLGQGGAGDLGPAAVDAGRAGRTLQGRPANGVRTEWLRLLEALSEAERQELLDYARFKANRKRATATRNP